MHDDLPPALRELLYRALAVPSNEREAFVRNAAETSEQALELLTLLSQNTEPEATLETVVRATQAPGGNTEEPRASIYPDRVQSTATGDLLLKI